MLWSLTSESKPGKWIHGGWMFNSSGAAVHLHGSSALVNGSARWRADLMYCRVTCGSLNSSYEADKFSLWTFLRCLNLALYPPWTIWMTEALSCWHTKLMGLFNTKSKRSCIGTASPKTPESREMISASQVLLAVAPLCFDPQHRGQNESGPSSVRNIPDVDFTSSISEAWSASVYNDKCRALGSSRMWPSNM